MAENIVEYKIRVKDIDGSGIDGFKKKIEGIGATVGVASKSVENLNSLMVNLNQSMQVLQNVSGALNQINATIGQMTGYYMKQVEAETKLQQVMRNTMGATNAQVQAILNLTAAQQKLGVIGDEVQLAGAQELATYMSKRESLQKLIPAMNDIIAQQYGFNASQEAAVNIATMMGKVFVGQTSALSRYGYTFDEAQEKVLKFGTEEEKAATLAQVVAQSVGGVNAALAATPTGKAVQLANAIGDIKEQAGRALQPVQGIVSSLSEMGMAALGVAQLHTAVMGLTRATGIAAAATKAWTAAQRALNITTLANPYVAAAAAAAALGYALYKLATQTTTAEKHQRALNDALKDAQVQIGTERRQVNYLFDALKKAESGTDEYRRAVKRINDLYGEYLPKQLTDRSNLDEIAAAHKRVTQAIADKVLIRMKDAAIEGIVGEEMSKQVSASSRLRENLEKLGVSGVASGDYVSGVVESAKRSYQEGKSFIAAIQEAFGNASWIAPAPYTAVKDEVRAIVESIYEVENASRMAEKTFAPLISGIAQSSAPQTVFSNLDREIADARKLVSDLEKDLAGLRSKKTPSFNYAADIASKTKELEEARKALAVLLGGDGKAGKDKKTHGQGAYGYETQEIARLKEQLQGANAEEQQALQNRIAALERIIALRDRELRLAAGLAAADGAAITSSLGATATAPAAPGIQAAQHTLRAGKKQMATDMRAFDESSTNRGNVIKIPVLPDTDDLDEKLKAIRAGIADAFKPRNFDDLQEGLNSISATMRSMSGIVGETASAWMEWGANVVQAIAQAIPAIVAITATKEVETQANSKAAVTGSASAMANIPYVGPILALAAMAAMIAAILAIPKFAAGGIAFGPTIGMFGEYAGASSNPEVVAPLDKLRDLIGDTGGDGKVVFRISGRDLEGVLEKRRRVRERTR